MSLPGKKGRDPSQLPTLSYEIKLKLPENADSNPQEISFLDFISSDSKFKNDKESLELVLSSYVKACGKQSVTEILAERDTAAEDNASLSDIMRALMDYNDQQNANLGVGYNDPEDDDSFIDDSTAAQDIIPKNITNERDGFYVNEKHQPIKARYLSDSSGSDSEEDEEESDDDDDDEDDESSESEKEDKQIKIVNHNQEDLNEKSAKKAKIDDNVVPKVPNVKRKRSLSEVEPLSLTTNADNKVNNSKPNEETVKKAKTLSETASESNIQNLVPYVLPNDMDNDVKSCIEKLFKLIVSDQTKNHIQKKIERLFDSNVCRELLDLVRKLHRYTNANRQLVFDFLSSKTGICTSILITRGRLLLLNDYEQSTLSQSLNELKEKLKAEVNRSLESHVQAHNQAVKEWQLKIVENPAKDKNRGPRKNFRLYKTINELIIRCVDRKLETMTILDADSLELFLHDHIVPLWEKPGWMTAKKIISEVIRIEYRPLRDTNLVINQQSAPPAQANRVTSTAERVKTDTPMNPPPPPSSSSSPVISTTKPSASTSSPVVTATKISQQQNIKTTDNKPASHSSTNQINDKAFEMATRVTANPVKQYTPMESTTSHSSMKSNKADVARPAAKSSTTSSASPSDLSTKRASASNPASVIDLTMDLLPSYKKHVAEKSHTTQKISSHSSSSSSSTSSNKDPSLSQRPTSSPTISSNVSKQQQQQQQFATKLPSDKSQGGSFLKEALMTGSSATKISASPLAVDNMISKTLHSPKTPTNTSIMKPQTTPTNSSSVKLPTTSTNTSTMKTSTTPTTPTHSTNQTQRSSGSSKSTTNRSSNEFSHPRTDQHTHHHKSSSSSNRSQSNTTSSSAGSSSSRRSITGFSGHEQQSNRGLSSQVNLPAALTQSLQWDPATLQLAAAALANPQLLNSSVFDPALFNSVFANAASMVSSSSSSSSARQQHSQNTNNNRRS